MDVGALYDPVFHVTDETSSAGAHFDVSQKIIVRTSTSISWVGEIGFNSFRYFTTKCRTSLSFSRQM